MFRGEVLFIIFSNDFFFDDLPDVVAVPQLFFKFKMLLRKQDVSSFQNNLHFNEFKGF